MLYGLNCAGVKQLFTKRAFTLRDGNSVCTQTRKCTHVHNVASNYKHQSVSHYPPAALYTEGSYASHNTNQCLPTALYTEGCQH